MPSDPFNLKRFEDAQSAVWSDVRKELRSGRKRTHWMWFVFPQLAVLGHSPLAKHFGLAGLDEAKAFLAHPILGERIKACCDALLRLEGRAVSDIVGEVDAMKLRSCLTLFMAAAGPDDDVFRRCLVQYFNGSPDPLTWAQTATSNVCFGSVAHRTGN